ncbi:MAG: VWA-like domain-containing protein [Alphaproteobacteria bacterium]|uniref:VWA-like domain-containing protein n=1 Tax=Candidatus Nitrobium versatile TaxID=2884831 RepID=A0A953LY69_9BACT|nr:VWA-like domain-containing protein [Candidatus Nitrobium versatile]
MDTRSRERISRARLDFLFKHPFLGDLSLRLKVLESGKTKTIATDARHLFFNPEFIKGLPDPHVQGVVAHEIGHCLFRHAGLFGLSTLQKLNITDQKGRILDPVKHRIWMAACEYMANHFVVDICRLDLPAPYCYERKYGDGTWTTEEIYHDLLTDADTRGVPAALVDDHTVWERAGEESGSSGEREGLGTLDQDWRVWVAQALHSAKRQGRLPAGLERLVGELLEPKLNWRQVLADFLISKAKDDYSWRKLNRRHLWREVYAPALYSETIHIGFALDTSGSITDEELREGLSELQGICGAFPSYKIHLFACDAEVQYAQSVESAEEVNIAALCRGGGGTSFVPVFRKIEEDGIPLNCLVYFTDGYGEFPDSPPEYPVLWMVKGHADVPWGRRCEL